MSKEQTTFRLRRSLDLNHLKTRGHKYRFSREKFSAKRENYFSRFLTLRHIFFLKRVASLSESLRSLVETTQSLNSSKTCIYNFLK